MSLSGRLQSVLQHLASSHREEAQLSERVGVLQASLFLVAAELPIRRLAPELLHLARRHVYLQEIDQQNAGLALECVAAAVYICEEKSGQGLAFLEDTVQLIFLPVLSSTNTALVSALPEVAAALFRILSQQRRWLMTHLLLNKCATTLIPISSSLPQQLQGPLTPMTQPADPGSIPDGDRGWLDDTLDLPPHTVLLLAKEGLASLTLAAGDGQEARACADSNVRQFMLCSLGALFGDDPTWVRAALQGLLPGSLRAAAAISHELRRLSLAAVWDCARYLLAQELGSGIGLELLCAFHEQLLGLGGSDANTGGTENGFGSHQEAPTAQSEELVPILYKCMSSSAFDHRKSALFLLSKLLDTRAGSPPWANFLQLYDVLEEFAPHLIESAWEEQMPTLLQSITPEREAGGALRFSMPWLLVLWFRAFSHKTGQVQRLAAQQLVEHSWTPGLLSQLPVEFVTGQLVATATSPSANKGQSKSLVTPLGCFLADYAAALDASRRWELVKGMLKAAGQPGIPRSSLQQHVAVLAAHAVAVGSLQGFSTPGDMPGRSAETLRLLAAAAALVLGFHGTTCRLGLAEGLVKTAAKLLPGGTFVLADALPLLDQLPMTHLKSSSALSQALQDWLLGTPERDAWMAAGISGLFQQLAMNPASPGSPRNVAVDEVEVASWRSAAQRLARVTALAPAGCGRLLEPAFGALQDRIRQLYHRPYLAKGAAERALLTLKALLEVVEPEAGLLQHEESSWLPYRLSWLLTHVQDELGMYTKAAWQTFWSPLSASGLPETQEAGLRSAPQRLGVKPSALPPSLEAALYRAHLCLECTLQGAVCLARYGELAGLMTNPLPPRTDGFQTAASLGGSAESPLAARRRSSSDASMSHTRRSLTDTGLQFVQCFASTPLPLPKRAASASLAAAYAQTRGLALGCLAASMQLLAAAAKIDAPTATRLAKEAHLRNLTAAALSLEAPGVTGLETWRWLALDGALQINNAAGTPPPLGLPARLLPAALTAVRVSHLASLPPLLRCIRFLLGVALVDPGAALGMARGLSNPDGVSDPLAAIYQAALDACWQALEEVDHPTNTLFAIFLQTLLPPAAFECCSEEDPGWRLHAEGAPLQTAVCRLLDKSGTGGARLMALAALQLTKLLTRQPALLPRYAGCYVRLLLYGVPISDDVEAHLEAEGLGGSDGEDLRLTLEAAESSAPAALRYTLLAGRVAAVGGIHKLSQLATSPDPTLAAFAEAAGSCLWARVFDAVVEENGRQQRGRKFHALSEVGREKLRLWQAAATLAGFVPPAEVASVVEAVFTMLTVETPAPVKANQEILLAHLLLVRNDLVDNFLLPRLRDYSQNTDGVASALLVAARVLFNSEGAFQRQLLEPVATALLPWAMLHNQSIRAYAQLVLDAVLRRFPELALPAEHSQLAAAAAFFEGSPSMKKLEKVRRWLERDLAPGAMLNPWKVFDEVGPSSGQEEEYIMREGAHPNLMDAVVNFLSLERANTRRAAQTGHKQADPAESASGAEGPTDLQRKLRPETNAVRTEPWEEALAAALPTRSGEAELAAAAGRRRRLVVVASLLDRAPNLAGLTRTCEVFQAERLMLGDLRVTRTAEFRGISVTAEQHVHLEEVRPEDLPAWLTQQRERGYTLLGLEQTAAAVPLPNFDFPPRTVLLLGREREGIPPNLLRLLDQALVIPQLGVIRSLNAHVSASIALYEYTRCHPE